MISGLHHVALIVSSEETVRFYKKLGFVTEKEIVRNSDRVLLMRGLGISLELFVDPKYAAGNSKAEHTGLRFLSFKVDDISKASLEFGGVPVQTDWNGNRYITVRDPDGTPVQFHE